MTTFAVVGMGAMGAGIAARLRHQGARVLTCLDGRSPASADRARAAGAEAVGPEELIGRAEIFLSVLPPDRAVALADRYLPLIRMAPTPPVWVDCNAIAPQTMTELASMFQAAALPIADAGIIGPPPREGAPGPTLYLSGPVSGLAGTLERFGLRTHVLSERLGDASAMKMSYACVTKGFQAIATAAVLGARENGTLAALHAELSQSAPGLHAFLTGQFAALPSKAWRFDGEMRQIARFLEPHRHSTALLTAAAEIFRDLGATERGEAGAPYAEAVREYRETK